ncbi:hypothetical protein [Pontiella sp.]|uniref:hypothetical protein n=1 Tax=Pontiella sp. TaxID=2837462 RepID=UPI003569CC77
MLRGLRIAGIVVFALLVGMSANVLWQMHESGELLERYNSQRKANVTLLVFSAIAVAALGAIEGIYLSRQGDRYGAESGPRASQKKGAGRLASSSIYATPETVDEWKIKRSPSSKKHHRRSSKSRHAPPRDGSGAWFGWLRLCAVALLLTYGTMLALHVMHPVQDAAALVWLFPALFAFMTLFSFIVAIGIFAKGTWALVSGYVLAMCSLLVFPVGTALGMLLLMGLVGASPVFLGIKKDRRPGSRPSQTAMV